MQKTGQREISEQSNGLGSHIQSWYIKAIIPSIEVRGSQFGHLYKRMLRETLASFHLDSHYIFWLDLAGCHYSKQTVAYMNKNLRD